MRLKQIIGYLLALVGLTGLAMTTFPEFKLELIPQLAGIDNTTLTIVSAVILVIGIILSLKRSRKAGKEVPIFEDENIVGYRRHK